MNEVHEINFRILEAMAEIEREVGHQLGLERSRSLTIVQEEALQAGAEAAVDAWRDAKDIQPDLEPRTDLERRCAEFIALYDTTGRSSGFRDSSAASVSA